MLKYWIPLLFSGVRAELVDWRDSRLISLVHNILSTSDSPCDKGTLNQIIDLATGGDGEIIVDLKNKPISGINNIELNYLTVSGLDSIKSADVLSPDAWDQTRLNTSLVFDELKVVLSGKATSKLVRQPPSSNFDFTVQFSSTLERFFNVATQFN